MSELVKPEFVDNIVKIVKGIPYLNRIIEPGTSFRGEPHQSWYTKKGYFKDEVASALQKCIRRGLLLAALFWANQLIEMGGPFISFCMNRLKVICSEDIGNADPYIVVLIRKFLVKAKKEKNVEKKRKLILGCVKALCLAPKNRWTDSIIHATMEPEVKKYPEGLKKLKFLETEKMLFVKKEGDLNDFVKYMNNFKYSLNEMDAESACYWSQKIYDLEENNKTGRPTSKRGKSKDPMYGCWEVFKKKHCGFMCIRSHREIIESLMTFYDDKKNGRSERLFLVQAILFDCYRDKIKVRISRDLDEFEIDVKTLKWLKSDVKIKMEDWAVDKHTKRGKDKTSEDFWTVGSKLENVYSGLKGDPWLDIAKKLNSQRDEEGVAGLKRKRMRKKKKKRKRKRDDENDRKSKGRKKGSGDVAPGGM